MFWKEMGYFSTFWLFSVKSPGAERISRAVLTTVGTVCSVGSCDSKSGCNLPFFWVLGYELGSSELADVGSAEGRKTESLSVPKLVWTRATSSAHPTMLGEGV